jgi:hypothetical protein
MCNLCLSKWLITVVYKPIIWIINFGFDINTYLGVLQQQTLGDYLQLNLAFYIKKITA